jgi:hypothetical protein
LFSVDSPGVVSVKTKLEPDYCLVKGKLSTLKSSRWWERMPQHAG